MPKLDMQYEVFVQGNFKGVMQTLNGTKKEIIPSEFTEISVEWEGIIVWKGPVCGAYVDDKLTIPVEYDGIYFYETAIVVSKNGLYGAYSYDGELIVPIEYYAVDCDVARGISVQKEKNGEYIPISSI